MTLANLYAALHQAEQQAKVLCRHCRWSEWSGKRQALVGTCPRLKGWICPEEAWVCRAFERETGADDA